MDEDTGRPEPPQDEGATPEELADQYQVTQSLWPDQERGPFLLALYWASVEGRAEVHGVELRSIRRPKSWGGEPEHSALLDLEADREFWSDVGKPPPKMIHPPRPLTSQELRLNLRAISEEHKRNNRRHMKLLAGLRGMEHLREELDRLEKHQAPLAKRGRRGHGFEYYAEAAKVYLKAEAENQNAVQAVAAWLGGERVNNLEREKAGLSTIKGGWTTYAEATKAVNGARARKLLPPARKGPRR